MAPMKRERASARRSVVRHVATAPTSCYFGEIGGGSAPRVDAVVAAFNAAGIASKAADDITHVEWEKLLQISVVAAWSASTLDRSTPALAHTKPWCVSTIRRPRSCRTTRRVSLDGHLELDIQAGFAKPVKYEEVRPKILELIGPP